MEKSKRLNAEFNKSARVISDYENDLIFEQPRENLLQQEFISYEWSPHGIRRTTVTRKFRKNGDYSDHSVVEILG